MNMTLITFNLYLICLTLCIVANGWSTCDITHYGAVGNGSAGTDEINRVAFVAAIADCGTLGGVVRVPPGRFLTAPFNLTSNIVLEILVGGTILGTLNTSLIPLMKPFPSMGGNITRDGYLCRFAPLIGAYNASNITITGLGTIDGQGSWWWDHRKTLNIQSPRLVELQFVDGLHINGVSMQNSPFWTLHPYASKNIHIHDIRITADGKGMVGKNTDGIDPDSCQNVLIEDYYYCAGDDAIAIKSGWNWAGIHFGMPSRNITVRRCYSGCRGGFTIGSEMSGGIENIRFVDCVSTGESGIRISSELGRGGYVRNVLFKNISFSWEKIQSKTFLLHVNQDYKPDNPNKTLSYFSNISFTDLVVTKAPKNFPVGDITCLNQTPCYNISFNGVHLLNVSSPKHLSCSNCHGTQRDVDPAIPEKCCARN